MWFGVVIKMPMIQENPFTDPEVVDDRHAVQTLFKYLSSFQHHDNSTTDTSVAVEDCDDDYNFISGDQIDEALAEDRDQNQVKLLVRTFNLSVLRPERRLLWKAIFSRMTDARGFGDAILSNEDLFNETLVSCFGTTGTNDWSFFCCKVA